MTTHWLYPANTKYYDVIEALSQPYTYWPMKSKASPGDIIYIYLAAPYKQIAYVCRVKEVSLEKNSIFENIRQFVKGAGTDDKKDPLFMKLEPTKQITLDLDSSLTYHFLKQHGLKGMLMGPRKLENNPELLNYIQRNE